MELYPEIGVWDSISDRCGGFVNAGNSCYIGAALQAPFHVPIFTKWLKEDERPHMLHCPDSVVDADKAVDECVTCALRAVSFRHTAGGDVVPTEVFDRLPYIGESFSIKFQEDAHEFLILLFNRVASESATGNQVTADNEGTTPLIRMFGCRMKTSVVCCVCEVKTELDNYPVCFSVDILQDSNIQNAMDNARAPLPVYARCQCSGDANVLKYSVDEFLTFPNFLIIQLVRFTRNGLKNNKIVNISEQLFLIEMPYKLLAAIIHLGATRDSGHYTCLCRESNKWVYYNDDKASEMSDTFLQSEAFCREVYVLFYERNQTFHAKPVPQSQKLSFSVERKNPDADMKASGSQYLSLKHHKQQDISTNVNISVIEGKQQPKLTVTGTRVNSMYQPPTIVPSEKRVPGADLPPKLNAVKKDVRIRWLKTRGCDFRGKKSELIARIHALSSNNLNDELFSQTATGLKDEPLIPSLDLTSVQIATSPEEISEEKILAEEQCLVVSISARDIPGAILLNKPLQQTTVSVMKTWLKIKGLKLEGNKVELWERIQDQLAMENSDYVDPGYEDGKWYLKKQDEVRRKVVGQSVLKRHPLPISGWKEFPSGAIPKFFNEGMVYNYLVERYPQKYEESPGSCNAGIPSEQFHSTKPSRRGWKYVRSEHLSAIEDNFTGDLYFLRSNIKASMKKDIHYVTVAVSVSSGFVLYGTCDCVACSLGRCAHIASLLYFLSQYIEDFGHEVVACTSLPRSWGLGSIEKDPGMIRFKDYSSRASISSRATSDPRASRNQLELPSVELFQNFVSSLPKRSVLNWHTLIRAETNTNLTSGNSPRKENASPSVNGENRSGNSASTEVTLTVEEKCLNFINSLRNSTRNMKSAAYLVPGTEEQGGSAWKTERSFRITASMCREVLGLGSLERKRKFLAQHMWHMTSFDNEALRWGRENEHNGFSWYSSEIATRDPAATVQKTGLWASVECPELGCSPDGLIILGSKEIVLLEIKCPFILRKHSVIDFDSVLTHKQSQRFNLKKKPNGEVVFNSKHSYYYQIQMSMGILNVSECHFVTWTPVAPLCVQVQFDEAFWMGIRNRLVPIYRQLFVPEWISQRAKRHLQPQELTY